MKESKIDLTHRLQKDGSWAEASAFKDDVKNRLRGKGLKRAEAGEKAWEAMALRYPPPEALESKTSIRSTVLKLMAAELTDDDPAVPVLLEIAAGVDAFKAEIDESVASVVSGWCGHFEIDLDENASQSLAKVMVSLIEEYAVDDFEGEKITES